MTETSIILIGPMGSGKSTIGRLLAKELGYPFYDSDKEIEAKTGANISTIFEYEGEAGFRLREAEILDTITRISPIILATGGGAILLPENQIMLKARGYVVYLQCSVDKQFERTQKDSNRPLLLIPNPKEKLREIFLFRAPIYKKIADFTIDTGLNSSKTASKQIIQEYLRSRTSIDENC